MRPIAGAAARLRPGPVVGGYLLRGAVSVASVVVAMVAVLSLAAVAGPKPDSAQRGTPDRVPAALPPVPVPAGITAPLPPRPAVTPDAAPPQRQPDRQPAPRPQPSSQTRQQAYSQWAAQMSQITGIPARALSAYAYAHAVMAELDPSCNLTWVTLAGIGRIESNHGRFNGRSLTESGVPTAPIIGVALDGSGGNMAIGDTDGGALDGDPVWDRAVGPMQFIPTTWANWATDGDGNGVGNPQDIDDAALAAARYLCAGDRNLATGEGWLQAVLSYNHSRAYASNVYQAARQYASSVSQS